MDLKEHILTEADALFSQHGVKSVTMDDIARHLGISKKTIYQHFDDKKKLVHSLMINKVENECGVINNNINKSSDAVGELLLAVTHVREMFSKINPMMFYDLQKYYPEAWKVFQQFRDQYLYKRIADNLKRGVSEGNYRKDINIDILSKMRIHQIDMVFGQYIYPIGKYNIAQVMASVTEHFLYGICTLRGHKLINKYKEIKEEE